MKEELRSRMADRLRRQLDAANREVDATLARLRDDGPAGALESELAGPAPEEEPPAPPETPRADAWDEERKKRRRWLPWGVKR